MNTLNYQTQVAVLEAKRETALEELENAMDQLIASTLQVWTRLDQIIASKKSVAQAKWKQMNGIEGQLQAKAREINSLGWEIQTIRQVEIPAKKQRITDLTVEGRENYEQHKLLMSVHKRETAPDAMLRSHIWSLLSLGRGGQNKAKNLTDRQRNMAGLKKRRDAIADQLLPNLERDIQGLNQRIFSIEIRIGQIQATAQTLAGKRDEIAAEIQDLLGRSIAQLEDQKRSPREVQLIDQRVDQLKRSIAQINQEITHLLELRRAEIIAQAHLLRRLLSTPGTNNWRQIEALLNELRFIQAHHP